MSNNKLRKTTRVSYKKKKYCDNRDEDLEP